jgi:bifunctional non-homologous end joining protein LigD
MHRWAVAYHAASKKSQMPLIGRIRRRREMTFLARTRRRLQKMSPYLSLALISDFNGLHSRKHDHEVMLYAFDILALEGNDLRTLPLHLRKTNLARLLARRPEGVFVSEFEQGEIGPDLFRQACKFGLEGLVSKRRDRPYRAGRSPDWIKVQNRSHPSLDRVKDSHW